MDINNIENEINKSIALCVVGQHIETFCPLIAAEPPRIDPKTKQSSYNIKISSMNYEKFLITRYGLRAFYHAINFIKQYKIALNNINTFKKNYTNNDSSKFFGTVIQDSIIYEFDAFLYSCKSILKKDLADSIGNKIDNSLKIKSRNILLKAKNDFKNLNLDVIRNEAIHLNYYGSSYASMAKVVYKDDNTIISIPYSLNNLDSSDDIVSIFINLSFALSECINSLIRIIIEHIFIEFGKPEVTRFQANDGIIVEIPEMIIKMNPN